MSEKPLTLFRYVKLSEAQAIRLNEIMAKEERAANFILLKAFEMLERHYRATGELQ